MMTQPSNLPGYVANIPFVVPDDDEGMTSAGEDSLSFPQAYYDRPHEHFRMHPPKEKGSQKSYTYRRGTVIANSDSTDDAPLSEKYKKVQAAIENKIGKYCNKGFAKSDPSSKRRLRVVAGLNKMRSISNSRNRSIKKLARDLRKKHEPHQILSFFWEGVYEEKKGKQWKQVPQERVKQFYRSLKVRHPIRAKTFCNDLERKRGDMVPYRGIRERISQSKETQRAVRSLRTEEKVKTVFVGIFDGDPESVQAPDGKGIFTHYDKMVQKKPHLQMGSGGYLFSGKNPSSGKEDPLTKVGSELDLATRHATAKFFGYGVYYPEPNAIIRVPNDRETIPYSFEKPGETHYQSPQESIVIMEQVRERHRGDQSVVAFDRSGALLTATPERAERLYNAHYDRYRKIVRWTEMDLRTMRGLSQSHFHPKKWTDHLIRDLDIKKQRRFTICGQSVTLRPEEQRNLIKSLLSRLFKHYDAISMARYRLKQLEDEGAAFPEQFIAILENYDPHRTELAPVKTDPKRKGIWKEIDKISTLESLLSQLKAFLPEDQVINAQKAAKQVGQDTVKLFKKRFVLNFSELSLALMRDHFDQVNNPGKTTFQPKKPNATNQCVLDNHALSTQSKKKDSNDNYVAPLSRDFRKMLSQDAQRDAFGATPMHWAAVTGNKHMIKELKLLNRMKWAADIHAKAKGDILPLHLAIKYCGDNANDLELIQTLLDKQTAKARAVDWKTPLVLCLENLRDPLPVIELLYPFSVLSQTSYETLKSCLQMLHAAQCAENILVSLLTLQPSTDHALLLELIDQGLSVTTRGVIYHKEDLATVDDEVNPPYGAEADPIVLAVRTGNRKLVAKMIDKGASLTEVYDHQGNPPLTAAVHLNNAVEMSQFLLKNDANPEEEGVEYGGMIQHPAIYEVIEKQPFSATLFQLLLKGRYEIDDLSCCQVSIMDYALQKENSQAVMILIDRGYDTGKLSPHQTKLIRQLTGRKDIMCDEDLEYMYDKGKRRAIKFVAGLLEKHLDDPAVRKETARDTVETMEEFEPDVMEYSSDDTSSYDSNLSDSEEDSSENSDDTDSSSSSHLAYDFVPEEDLDSEPDYIDYPDTPPDSDDDGDSDLPLSAEERSDMEF